MSARMKELRDRLTGDSFGRYYSLRVMQDGQKHWLRLYANGFEVTITGALVLTDKDDKPYRAFAPGMWEEICTVSCLDGSEMYEDRDCVEAHNPHNSK